MKTINDYIIESSKPQSFIYKGVTGKILYKAFINALKKECKKDSKYDWTWAAKEYETNIKNLDEDKLSENALYWLNKIIVLSKGSGDYGDETKLHDLFKKYWDIELEGWRQSEKTKLAGTSHLIVFKFGDDGYTISSNCGLGSMTLLNKYGVEDKDVESGHTPFKLNI